MKDYVYLFIYITCVLFIYTTYIYYLHYIHKYVYLFIYVTYIFIYTAYANTYIFSYTLPTFSYTLSLSKSLPTQTIEEGGGRETHAYLKRRIRWDQNWWVLLEGSLKLQVCFLKGLFFKRALQKRRYSAKETYNLKEPTNRSHHIPEAQDQMRSKLEASQSPFGRKKNPKESVNQKGLRNNQQQGEVGGWGRDPFSRNLMSPTPRRKWYLTTGRRAH